MFIYDYLRADFNLGQVFAENRLHGLSRESIMQWNRNVHTTKEMLPWIKLSTMMNYAIIYLTIQYYTYGDGSRLNVPALHLVLAVHKRLEGLCLRLEQLVSDAVVLHYITSCIPPGEELYRAWLGTSHWRPMQQLVIPWTCIDAIPLHLWVSYASLAQGMKSRVEQFYAKDPLLSHLCIITAWSRVISI